MKAKVVPLEQSREQLGQLVAGTSQPIYLHPTFLSFLVQATSGEARVVLVERDGRTVGALPFLTLLHSGMGRVVNSLPWWGSHGGCAVDVDAGDADKIRRELLTAFLKDIDGPDLLSATLTLTHAEENAREVYADVLCASAEDYRIGQITGLPATSGPDGVALIERFGQKTRNLVRKSLKQGFVERVSDDDAAWDFLHRIHEENILALGGKPKPRHHFEVLRRTLPPEMRRLSLALDGNAPVAALLLLYGGETVEYITPAVDVTARSRQPLSFLIWAGMLDAIDRGFAVWNWGGTWVNQTSLHHFKAGFGAKDHHYTYFTVASAQGVANLRARRAELGTLFPYFYTYPYAALANSS